MVCNDLKTPPMRLPSPVLSRNIKIVKVLFKVVLEYQRDIVVKRFRLKTLVNYHFLNLQLLPEWMSSS